MTHRILKYVIGLWIVGYVALLGIVIWGMSSWRQSIVVDMSTSEAKAAWNQYRAEAAKDDGTHGPVQRTVPKSPEPPMLVLLRDYFPACLIGLLTPLSALYAVVAWMSCGVLWQSSRPAATRPGDRR